MEFDGAIVHETDKPNGQPCHCLDTERAKLAALVLSRRLTSSRATEYD